MDIRRYLALLLTILLLAVSAPSPGWGGGQDILIGGHNGGGGGGPDKPGDKENSTAGGYKTTRLDAPASRSQEQRTWLSWVRDMLRLLLGGRLSFF